MATVLSISSQVARGHVGLSATQFALERLGHEVWSLPTILLSNHPGHARYAGEPVDAMALGRMLGALQDNGWLAQVDGVLTGYLPSAVHVVVAAELVTWVRSHAPEALVLCDPALGDDPKGVYVDPTAAEAIRSELLPLADIAAPNRFELEWLTGHAVANESEALVAAEVLGQPHLLATSIPGAGPDRLLNLHVGLDTASKTDVERRPQAPHGTGDLIAALFFGHVLDGRDSARALALATAGVEAVLDASVDADELKLVQSQAAWTTVEPWPVLEVDAAA
ncbi:MAG: pyridoxal kinase [Methyloligellaceae bacterium]